MGRGYLSKFNKFHQFLTYRNVATEMSRVTETARSNRPDRIGSDRNGSDRNGLDRYGQTETARPKRPDRNGQTETARPKRPDRIGQTEKSCTPEFHRWFTQSAELLLLLSVELMSCCAAGTNRCLKFRRRLFPQGGQVSSWTDVHAPWHGVLETVWLFCDKAQQVGCLRE